jgi:hypothetical protein
MSDKPGARVFEIRAALGSGPRKPLSQEAFAALLNTKKGRTFYGPEISMIERDKKDLTREDIAIIASVDPLSRSKEWLGWGDVGTMPKRVDPGKHLRETDNKKKGRSAR